jgi:hypothetical protein
MGGNTQESDLIKLLMNPGLILKWHICECDLKQHTKRFEGGTVCHPPPRLATRWRTCRTELDSFELS